MEIKRNNQFNKIDYLKQTINQFINKPTYAAVEKEYKQLMQDLDANSHLINLQQYQIKLKIITDCYNFFKLSHVREKIADAKKDGISHIELMPILTRGLCESCFKDDKRHYNMSKITSNGMVLNTIPPEFESYEDNPEQPNPYKKLNLQDLHGEPMTIQLIGTLKYHTRSSNEYLNKYRISKQINGTLTEIEVFSNIDVNQLLEDKNYYYAVLQDLLSDNNIELSFADSYIGEITGVEGSRRQLKVGEESFDKDLENGKIYGYKYQISQKYALIYDGERLEAIRTYNKIQEKKKESEQSNEDIHDL